LKNYIGGTSDPFVTVSLGRHAEAGHAPHKTRSIKKTLNPVWEEEFNFPVNNPQQDQVWLQVWDWDRFSSNDPLGEKAIPVSSLLSAPYIEQWFVLDNTTKGELHAR